MWSVLIEVGPSKKRSYRSYCTSATSSDCPGPEDPDDNQEDGFLDELLTGLSSGVACNGVISM